MRGAIVYPRIRLTPPYSIDNWTCFGDATRKQLVPMGTSGAALTGDRQTISRGDAGDFGFAMSMGDLPIFAITSTVSTFSPDLCSGADVAQLVEQLICNQ